MHAVMATPDQSATGPAHPSAEAALVRALARGDHGALDALYEMWFARAAGIARSISGRDEAFGMDVAQEVFLRLIRRPPAVDGVRSLEAWMVRVVHAATIDALRAETRRTRRERRAGSDEQPAAGGREELIESLRVRLAVLEGEERLLLGSRFVQGTGLAEIGRAVGATAAAVHARIGRIIKRMGRKEDER